MNSAASAAEFVAKDAAASAKVGGATTAGSIVEKRAAANAAARTGGRIAAGRAVLGAASKASGVATVAATAFSAGARAAFYPDCKDPHPCDEESANEE